ncbi:hypothetical protein N7532_012150 [Penicillium argentinense]|uniref:Epoxide hydrolase N-terminal domain-containing protein n=1 Tax=Penicillium argentinense TaxID=1131581 RepID=A0A9W9EJU0_9EURO|nr:uncharacterized protein N7532_012150 [Penicillium argentinense]KAJ5083107.1 hypothetical protein N7532_012150 [Penicillium argentinense]
MSPVAASAATPVQQSKYAGLNFSFPDTRSPQRFNLNVNQDFVDYAIRKVHDYRPSPVFSSSWTAEGPPAGALTSLADYWAKTYDWRKVEKQMNEQFAHYATTVPGNGDYTAPIPLHFVHERSNDNAATPLLLIHGWASTHLEWSRVIEPLTHGSNNKSFHIVAVDLPGFGFSPAATMPGLRAREIGRAFDALMKQLGYEKYGIVTTDLGWLIGMWMVEDVHDSIVGHFTDFFLVPASESDLARQARGETTEEENNFMATAAEWFTKHASYATVMNQKPSAISFAFTDSPVGFAGWLWDLKYGSSDGYLYEHEELITDTMLQWIQPPYHAIRAYSDMNQPDQVMLPRSNIPTGVTQWGGVNGPFTSLAKWPLTPRTWIERMAPVTYFKRHDFGGHWPAVTHPNLWVNDVVEFFSSL